MQTAFRMGWPPSEFWAATLAEFELALMVRIEDAEAQTRTHAMSEDEVRGFYDRLQASE